MRIFIVAMAVIVFTGCSTIRESASRNLSASETQAKQNADAVNLAAIQAGQVNKLLSTATNNVDKGFRMQDSGQELARDIDGNAIFIDVPVAGGTIKAPIYVNWSTELSLSSYVDLADNIEGLDLSVGQLANLQDKSNQIYRTTPNRNGLQLRITKAGGSSTNATALQALKDGQAAEKVASGNALAQVIKLDWEGRKGTYVEVIKAGGEVATGVLMSLTPIGQAGKLAEATLRNADGAVETVVVEKGE